MPEVISEIPALRERLRRSEGSIGFVPTMGALHAGHATLLDYARRETDTVVASIFVNPLQFDRKDDLDRYPRTFDADLAICQEHGVDVVFAPTVSDLYPGEQLTFVDVPELGRHLCGVSRAGHFRGVATVVLKLFNIVQPDRAYFGEKDAQQLAVIRQMVRDLNVPIEIIGVPTVRESDGLALSSRNKHLTVAERAVAPALYAALQAVVSGLDRGERDVAALRQLVVLPDGFRLEYLEIADPVALVPQTSVRGPVLVAAAAWLGTTRLIDNVTWLGPDATIDVSA